MTSRGDDGWVARRLARARARRRRNVAQGVAIVVAALVLVAIYFIWRGWRPQRPGVSPMPRGLEVVRVITGPGEGAAPDFKRPLGAAWGPSGRIYVSDTDNGRICAFTEEGAFLWEAGGEPTSTAVSPRRRVRLVMPVGLDIGPDGTAYVADLKRGAVFAYNPAGEYVRAYAPRGSAGTWRPTGAAVDGGRLYVVDASGVEVFGTDGTAYGRLAIDGDRNALARPNGIAVGPDGLLYISDTNNMRVLSVTPDGETRFTAGSAAEDNRVFGLPRGLAVMQDGSILVADAFKFGMVQLSAEGGFQRVWGRQGADPGQFSYPNDVDVAGADILVTDKENHRVQVVRLPAQER